MSLWSRSPRSSGGPQAGRAGVPDRPDAIAWLVGALVLYGIATLLRGERWHWILAVTGVRTHRSDCYALTTVGYMGNNVLPARAGEALKVVLMAGRCDASKRTLLGSVVAERILDLIALAVIFVVVVYGALSSNVLPTDRPVVVAAGGVVFLIGAGIALWVLRRHHVFERARDWLRPLADSPRALLSKQGAVLLVGHVRPVGGRGGRLPGGRAVARSRLLRQRRALPCGAHQLRRRAAGRARLDRDIRRRRGLRGRRLGASGSMAVTYMLLLRFVLYIPITIVGLVVLVARYGGWSRLRSAVRLGAGPRRLAPDPRLCGKAWHGFVPQPGGSWALVPHGCARPPGPRAGRTAGR